MNIMDEIVKQFEKEKEKKIENKIENELQKELIKEFEEKMTKEFQKEIDKFFENNIHDNMQYDSKKQQIDSIYLHNIKKKTESLLEKIIEKFDLTPYISTKKRYRIDEEKWYQSKYKELYEQKKDINYKELKYGYEYIPIDFDDWTKIYLSDYVTVSDIYTNMCELRKVHKDDLKQLNKIAKKYIKNVDNS